MVVHQNITNLAGYFHFLNVRKIPYVIADISDEDILSYSRIYLVDDSLDGDDPEKLIKKNFKVIFEEELAGWYTDEEAWPKKMDLRVFKQWFHVKVHEIVVDIGKKLPIAEEY